MVGGGNGTLAQNQAACEQNLVSASFTGTFTSGWTFASTGATGNVFSSTYMDTSLTPSDSLSQDSTTFKFLLRSTGNIATNMVDMGSYDGTSGNSTYMVTSYGSIIYA
jgi:isocitrate lyase